MTACNGGLSNIGNHPATIPPTASPFSLHTSDPELPGVVDNVSGLTRSCLEMATASDTACFRGKDLRA